MGLNSSINSSTLNAQKQELILLSTTTKLLCPFTAFIGVKKTVNAEFPPAILPDQIIHDQFSNTETAETRSVGGPDRRQVAGSKSGPSGLGLKVTVNKKNRSNFTSKVLFNYYSEKFYKSYLINFSVTVPLFWNRFDKKVLFAFFFIFRLHITHIKGHSKQTVQQKSPVTSPMKRFVSVGSVTGKIPFTPETKVLVSKLFNVTLFDERDQPISELIQLVLL